MIALIYLALFAVYFIFSNLIATYLLESWRDWQAKQIQTVGNKLDDYFIIIEKKKLVLLSFSPFIFSGLAFLFTHHILSLVVGFILGLAFPALLMRLAKNNRVKKFQSQLVDVLMMLSSSLKGGLSFVQALEVVCEEMPPPSSDEFALVLKRNKLGVSLEDCLMDLRKRMPLEEINLLVSSIVIAKGTGGELTRVLSRLVETIRSNIKLKEKIATLTLQGRLQGIVMAVLPVVFTAFIYKQDPHHFDIMFETQLGKTLLVVALFAQILGMYLIKRISTLRI